MSTATFQARRIACALLIALGALVPTARPDDAVTVARDVSVSAPTGKRCAKPSADALAALREYVAANDAIRLHWSKPDGSDASGILRRQPNGKVHIVTASVDRSRVSRNGEHVLTAIQMVGETARWSLLSVSTQEGDQRTFINADPKDSEWQQLWSEILSALARGTGMCTEQQPVGKKS